MAAHDSAHMIQPHAPVEIGVFPGVKGLKDMLDVSRWNTGAPVPHLQHGVQTLLMAQQFNRILPASLQRSFPAVGDQVIQRFTEVVFIG